MADGIARGTVRAGFERVREVFEAGAADRPGVNLALAVRLKGSRSWTCGPGPATGPTASRASTRSRRARRASSWRCSSSAA
ncbi:hypothetical protein ACFQHO_20070 [Actinomadura yumaensis]|uniref:hypothetical protein n=1 Tax=Actinomadura yumaensis TaxID=111807 RepID=UPI00360C8485